MVAETSEMQPDHLYPVLFKLEAVDKGMRRNEKRRRNLQCSYKDKGHDTQ